MLSTLDLRENPLYGTADGDAVATLCRRIPSLRQLNGSAVVQHTADRARQVESPMPERTIVGAWGGPSQRSAHKGTASSAVVSASSAAALEVLKSHGLGWALQHDSPIASPLPPMIDAGREVPSSNPEKTAGAAVLISTMFSRSSTADINAYPHLDCEWHARVLTKRAPVSDSASAAQVAPTTVTAIPIDSPIELPVQDVVGMLPQFSAVRFLTLGGLGLRSASALEHCANLEEVDLSGNRLSKVKFMSRLPKLRRVDLCHNMLTSLRGLERLAELTELAADHNSITRLHAVSECIGLRQLYCAFNQIEQAREVYHLRELPHLAVLAVAGNPMMVRADARAFIVMQMSTLEVLDGVFVDSAEAKSAHARFQGKISVDLIADLRSDEPQMIRTLDVPRSGIKDCLCVHGDVTLDCLVSLNLENNLFTSIMSLSGLPSLRILNLSFNRVKKLSSREGTAPVFANLQVLHLAGYGLQSLEPMQFFRFPALRSVFLQDNDISSTRGLTGISDIRDIVLDGNRIREIDDGTLGTCPRLQELHLRGNRLKSLGGLKMVDRLKRLFVGDNRIGDNSEIAELAELRHLVELVLDGNPCARGDRHRMMTCHQCSMLLVPVLCIVLPLNSFVWLHGAEEISMEPLATQPTR